MSWNLVCIILMLDLALHFPGSRQPHWLFSAQSCVPFSHSSSLDPILGFLAASKAVQCNEIKSCGSFTQWSMRVGWMQRSFPSEHPESWRKSPHWHDIQVSVKHTPSLHESHDCKAATAYLLLGGMIAHDCTMCG